MVPLPSNTSFHRTGAVLNCLSTRGAKTILKIGSAAERSNCPIGNLLYRPLLLGGERLLKVFHHPVITPDRVLARSLFLGAVYRFGCGNDFFAAALFDSGSGGVLFARRGFDVSSCFGGSLGKILR